MNFRCTHREKYINDRNKNLFKSQKLSIKYLFRLLQLSKRQQEMAIDEDVESSQACPSMSYLFPGNTNYAKDIRSPLANFVPTRTKTSNLVRKLHASDFQSNNDDHLNLVKNMGINIISLPDGRVQLLHTLSNVSSQNNFFSGKYQLCKKNSLSFGKVCSDPYQNLKFATKVTRI